MASAAGLTALRTGVIPSDRQFDEIYPETIRFISHQHWTPVSVAVRAARLLTEAGATTILDIGAGPGKFCIIGALTTTAVFFGVDRRGSLVQIARAAAQRFGVERVAFARGNVVECDFGGFDGLYLFNPFYELVDPSLLAIDDDVACSPDLHRRYVRATERKLATMARGTAVVTYHGFGGTMPDSYARIHEEEAGCDRLVLWVRT